MKLAGKIALVTGGSRGIGRATALAFAAEGADIAFCHLDDDGKADETAGEIRALGRRALHRSVDVADIAAGRAFAAEAAREFGPIDILFNNAGIQRRGAFADFPKEQWDEIIATNLTAPFVVSQAVVRGMIAKKQGKIVHIASLMSELARPTVVPYTAAKGGVRQLTRGMAIELAPHNIQVNAIAPGYFSTEMNRALIDNAEFNAYASARPPVAGATLRNSRDWRCSWRLARRTT